MPESTDGKYQVRLEAFEGPMELLLHLIQVNKIDIYDIPIAALTEQYMAYLAEMRRFDIEVASEFLVMAATLLLIKSRMLLPKTPKEAEEDEEIDPREELVRRIVEYQRYKKVSLEMAERAEEESRFVGRAPAELPVRLAPPQGLSVRPSASRISAPPYGLRRHPRCCLPSWHRSPSHSEKR